MYRGILSSSLVNNQAQDFCANEDRSSGAKWDTSIRGNVTSNSSRLANQLSSNNVFDFLTRNYSSSPLNNVYLSVKLDYNNYLIWH